MRYLKKQQELEKLRSNLSDNLMESQKKLTEQLYDSIANYLQRYNKKAGFAYIFSYTKGGPIIVAPKTLDLTKDVLKGLNSEYTRK
jgi:outer membrane protein